MKAILTVFCLVSSLLLMGCEEPRVNVSEVQERDDKIYLSNSQEPFSGTVVSVYSSSGEGFGQPESEESYKNGILHGEVVHYYKNGQIAFKETYKDGKVVGEMVVYYKNGQLSEKRSVNEKGELDGEVVEYYGNGQLKSKGNYKDGLKDGEFVKYYENGKLESKETYR